MVDLLAPFTGFGDQTNTSVKFTILSPDGRVPNWQGGARLNKFEIPHSGRTINQYGGRIEWVVSFRCDFASIAELELMDELQGTRHTLRYEHGMTKRVGGTVTNLQGVDYLVLPNTMLESVTNETYEGVHGGPCEATLTFSRAPDLSAYYGFAVYSEDD